MLNHIIRNGIRFLIAFLSFQKVDISMLLSPSFSSFKNINCGPVNPFVMHCSCMLFLLFNLAILFKAFLALSFLPMEKSYLGLSGMYL